MIVGVNFTPTIIMCLSSHCEERHKTKTKGSTRLTYTGLFGGLEHLKIETRLIDDDFKRYLLKLLFMLFIIIINIYYYNKQHKHKYLSINR